MAKLYAFLTSVFLFIAGTGMAQSGSFDIKGQVTDTLGNPLDLATILLMNPTDSTMITYTRSNEQGDFTFPRLRAESYLVKLSYVGFMPLLIHVDPNAEKVRDLGQIRMVEISKDLFEVVVKEAKAPMSIRGDTIEYDASKFKVAPGSTVEDLLRRLPGMEVKPDGTISSEGQEIRRVTVDGRRFFGGDVKSATKNLPAEGISKVQVFDEETEEKKLTGSSSVPPEKMMNLTLKDEFKKGGFGKIIGGAGTEERAELKGNYNRFDASQQFSLIGGANNTGRNGLGWNDYQEFRGQQAFRWDDGGDFGFGGFGGEFSMVFGGGDSDDVSLSSNFFGSDQSGFPRNGNAGVNYTWFNEKTEVNAVYFYNHNQLLASATRNQQTFLPDDSFGNQDTTQLNNQMNSHLVQVRLEHKIDSFNTLIVNGSGSTAARNQYNDGLYQFTREDGSLSNLSIFDNRLFRNSLSGNGSMIYRKKYRKQGRSSAASAAYIYNQSDTEMSQASENSFFDFNQVLDSLAIIAQQISSIIEKQQIKSSLLHVEPIGEKFTVQTFYNFSRRIEAADRDVFDRKNGTLTSNDFLSRYYENQIDLHRLGTSLRYNHKGVNASVGVARQLFLLEGNFESGPSAGLAAVISREYANWIPNATFSYNVKRGQYINANYSMSLREPSIQALQPIVDNSNPLFIREGNPDLIPQTDHAIRLNYRRNNALKFTNFSANLNFNAYENQFVNEEVVDEQRVTTFRTINYKGGQRYSTWINYGFPIIKSKLTMQVNYSGSINESFALVNQVENQTNTLSHRGGINFNASPSEYFNAFFSANLGVSDTRYSINTSQNQTLLTENYSLDLTTQLMWSIYLSASFNYDRFTNDRFGFSQDVPILNASIYRVLPYSTRWEIRLSAYDLLNRNLGVSQFANANRVTETRTTTLTRYVLLSLTYNIKGINTKINSGNNYFY